MLTGIIRRISYLYRIGSFHLPLMPSAVVKRHAFHIVLTVIIPAPSRQAGAFTDLHLHIIMRMILILCIDIKPYTPALRMIDQTVLFANLHPLNGKAKHDLQQPRHISSSDITAPNIKISLIVSSCDRFFLLISFLRSIQRNSKTSITQDFLTFNQFLLDFPPATLAGYHF